MPAKASTRRAKRAKDKLEKTGEPVRGYKRGNPVEEPPTNAQLQQRYRSDQAQIAELKAEKAQMQGQFQEQLNVAEGRSAKYAEILDQIQRKYPELLKDAGVTDLASQAGEEASAHTKKIEEKADELKKMKGDLEKAQHECKKASGQVAVKRRKTLADQGKQLNEQKARFQTQLKANARFEAYLACLGLPDLKSITEASGSRKILTEDGSDAQRERLTKHVKECDDLLREVDGMICEDEAAHAMRREEAACRDEDPKQTE